MQTLTMRPYAGDMDTQAVCDLLNACDAVDKFDDNYSVEALRSELSHPKIDPQRDLSLWEDNDGQLIGFGQLWIDVTAESADAFLYFRVHPEERGEGVEDAILAWASARMRQVGKASDKPIALRSGTVEQDRNRNVFLEHQGFSVERYFITMHRSLDGSIPEPQFPTGITLRHVASEADIAEWVAAFNLSFIDHWNFHPTTVEDHRHHLSDPNYHAERDLIAVTDDGTVAGFCFCFVNADDNARNNRREGHINLLGTRRGFRQLGLGRALLLAALQRFKADGMDTVSLGCDAENPSGALQFYEATGFQRVMTRVSYVKRLTTND